MPFYSNAHIDFVDYAKMRILIFVMKKSIYIAIALFFSTLAAFSQKDPLVGFYMGKISNQTSYPFGQSPELCLEVSRFGESYQLKLTARPLLRTDNYGSASGLKAENGKIVLKNFSKPRFVRRDYARRRASERQKPQRKRNRRRLKEDDNRFAHDGNVRARRGDSPV